MRLLTLPRLSVLSKQDFCAGTVGEILFNFLCNDALSTGLVKSMNCYEQNVVMESM
jgi:hypothetical protein